LRRALIVAEKLNFTGERFTPECEREIWYEHIHRYAFAARLCKGANVLDAACGEGYGAALLSDKARSVTGVDLDESTISHATRRYREHENLKFQVADCTKLPFEDDSFDVIVSFETLEHLESQDTLIADFRRVLSPSGFLLLSCPDKAEYSDKRGFQNEFHVRELYRDQLQQLISSQFPVCRLMGQKLMFHSVIWDMDGCEESVLQTLNGDGELIEGVVPHNPMYFIALCAATNECLPQVSGSLNLFDDHDETVYAHYHHEIRKNMKAGRILADRDEELESVKRKLSSSLKPWWQRLFGKK
jgi:ubiquinone/menaquinone biosynthesis C-methylase UbiE